MAEFEFQDLSDSVFWGVDLSRTRFRDVDLSDTVITHARLRNVEIDAFIDNVTINGVNVTAYVNERDPWFPLRAMLGASDPEGMRATGAALDDLWATTIDRARKLPEAKLHESVNDEWSFVQTLRHLVFAIDKWFTVPILGEPFHPVVLPNSGSDHLEWPGRRRDVDPTFAEAYEVWDQRTRRVREYLATVTASELAHEVDVLENGTTPVRQCIAVVFEEEFEHNRYANRDLAQLGE